MLPQQNRLKRLNTRLLPPNHKRRMSTSALSLIIYPNLDKIPQSSPHPQFAIAVPKRLDKRSTRRNRTKRLLSEAIYSLLPTINSQTRVVVMANKIFWHEKLELVVPEVKNAFKKAGLLKN